ncbi:MAG: methionyl-tRNA formyltransferase [Deltaproteobacteria bacterium RIFCSPLOWO2_12_FULL_40_28]|nr:MAG: methionyl-tRNA formyltransferase [Deltaproteobacteria bacterium RIFCSPHIGHO2_02_FULL_40_28]OGQ19109.1 MAG: methionyl-tRNA formyltransferase [Deltaproteobacteria bacterium RIFCSPHIGHO2_12_FULL_40_32]OGQ40281.1 MAG: methionyl-tRNA formyltransferase [Deltaproteobacteria bacterium RIFCSPLOWO2_02_FULL_40_36]OGQ53552.1 MAG: methionyl-tRNA formyltransferase [Deltaproteobacteria bacterium RIFCSPLOWO2_12_FULL_40_28]
MLPTIIFMGSPHFARVVLEALHNANYPLLAVVTGPDRPSGRGQQIHSCETALFAKEKKIKLYQPTSVKEPAFIQEMKKLKPDFFVIAAFGQFLPKALLEIPKIAPLNLHASLLPYYRGAAPIHWAVLNGENKTGVSLMHITSKMDAGPVYATAETPIDPNENSHNLTMRLAQMGAKLLLAKLDSIFTGKLKAIPQDDSRATYASSLTKNHGLIHWNKSAQSIHNQVRGLIPWPVSHTFIDNKLLKIYDSLVLPEKSEIDPGNVVLITPRGIHVSCFHSTLCLTEVQLEGKKRMSASEFARGYRLKEGMKFA